MRIPLTQMSIPASTSPRPVKAAAATPGSGTVTPRISSSQTAEASQIGVFDWSIGGGSEQQLPQVPQQQQHQSDPFSSMFANASSTPSSSTTASLPGHPIPPFSSTTPSVTPRVAHTDSFKAATMQTSLTDPHHTHPGGEHTVIPPTPGPSHHGGDAPRDVTLAAGGGGGKAGGVMCPTQGGLDDGRSASKSSSESVIPSDRRRSSQSSVQSGKPSLPGSIGSTTSFGGRQHSSASSFATQPSSISASPLSEVSDPVAKLNHPTPSLHLGTSAASWPVAVKSKKASQAEDLSKYRALEALSLAKMIRDHAVQSASDNHEPPLLILDIRPSTAFASSRIAGSVNVCAPSTLLRRPGVTVDRVESEMLQSDRDRAKFTKWRQGPRKAGGDDEKSNRAASTPCTPGGVEHIVVLDYDTVQIDAVGRPSVGGGGPCLLGMLKKFDAAGFAGELYWLVGGYAGFSAIADSQGQQSYKSLVEEGATQSSSQDGSGATPEPVPSSPSQPKRPPVGKLRLPDFGQQRHASVPHDFSPSSQNPPPLEKSDGASNKTKLPFGALPKDAFTDQTTTKASTDRRRHQSMLLSASESNLFGHNSRVTSGPRSSAACNPFFDNIRQNRELQHGITEKIPLDLSFVKDAEQQKVLPPFVRDIASKDQASVADQLAQDFFDIEKAEQTRLMATMRQHAAQSSIDPRQNQSMSSTDHVGQGDHALVQLSSTYCSVGGPHSSSRPSEFSFPFSIAAAIERGSENRYNNIWTYEHSRVPVSTSGDGSKSSPHGALSSYLNGSFVQPLREFGSYRNYIATQAPLPTTFETFWNTVWQQNSSTIAMLTREYESGRVQSHNYWSEEAYGSTIKLKLIEEFELNSKGELCTSSQKREKQDDGAAGGFFFPSISDQEHNFNEPVMVRRKLALSVVGSDEGSREITHFQYIGWPDYSIPEDPEALLVFMDLVSQAQHEAHLKISKQSVQRTPSDNRKSATGPLVLHCSAGVGRTGTYVVIDSVLDVLRQERRRLMRLAPLAMWDNGLSGQIDDACNNFVDVDMTPAGNSAATFTSPALQSPFKASVTGTSESHSAEEASHRWAPTMQAFAAGHDEVLLSPKSSSADLQRDTSVRRRLKRELSPSADMDLDERSSLPASADSESNSLNNSAPTSVLSSPRSTYGQRGSFSFSRAGGSLRRDAKARGLRRQRSDTSDDASIITTDAEVDRPFSVEDRDSPLPPAAMMAGSGSASARSSFSQQTRSGKLGSLGPGEDSASASGWIPTGFRHAEGMDTPSRAMDGMNLGLSSSSSSLTGGTPPPPFQFGGVVGGSIAASTSGATPSTFKLSMPPNAPAQPPQQQQQSSAAPPQRRFSVARTTHSSASEARSSPNPPASIGHSHKSSTRSSGSLESADIKSFDIGSSSSPTSTSPPAAIGEKDLVRHATHIAREQRMSSVQTQRQYVFCYLAVVKGVLREVDREKRSRDGLEAKESSAH